MIEVRNLGCFAVALVLAGRAGAAQWREVLPPTVSPIEALTASPTAPGELTASSNRTMLGAGIARSTDDGVTWRWVPSPSGAPLFTDFEHHPRDPEVLWGASYQLWRSADAGITWKRVYSHANATTVVTLDPGNPERVYAVGPAVIPGSTLHQSIDGGETWFSTWPVYFDDHDDVLVVPGPGLGLVLLASGTGILRSIDGGARFTNVLAKPARKLAVGARNPLALWGITANGNQHTRVFRSLDGGLTWTKVATPADDLMDIVAHPTDPARAWVVGTESGALYTLDGGQTWVAGIGVPPMAGLASIVRSRASSTTLFAGGRGGYGGVWRSTDGGVSWAPAGAGLKTAVPDLRFDAAGRLLAAGLGVPLRLAAEDAPWEVLPYPKGATSTVADLSTHPSDALTLVWLNATEGQFVFDRLELSTDGGQTWVHITPPLAKNWSKQIHAVTFDSDGGTLYAGGRDGVLYRSGNLGVTWTSTSAPWSSPRQLVPDPHGNTRLFATDATAFHRSFDQGKTWRSHPIGPSSAWAPDDLTVSTEAPDVLWVLSGTPQKRLYRSDDAGAKWSAIGAGLPSVGLSRLAVDPTDAARLLVGTVDHGVYLSLDGGASFVPWNAGLAHPRVLALGFDPQHPGRALLSTAMGELLVHEF